MNCCDFKNTLHYVSPAHGGWGVIRIAALVPESHQLFVSPFACGRHGALGGALNGIKDKVSYVYIDESDIVSGGYEELIPNAVDELFEFLEKRPRVLLLFVSCLDDLLGTDHAALNRVLSEKYPDVIFRSCHMNPISLDTKFPPGVTLQNNIYSLLERSDEKLKTVNLIGNNSPVDRRCELYKVMEENGYEVRHITDSDKFDDFLEMSKSCLNILLSPVAKYASEEMEKNLGIEMLKAYNTYDISEINDFYKSLSDMLGIKINTAEYEKRAENSIEEALKAIGDYPIAIDYQAVKKPFTLAKALIEYGFNVGFVMTDEPKAIEKEAYDYIRETQKQIRIVNAVHPDLVKYENRDRQYLCIGFDCGYATGSEKVIDMMDDEFLFGFYGVEILMEKMIDAYHSSGNIKEMIKEAGLII